VTLTRREASELLATHGLAPRRSLGQNFVVDPNTVRRIARLAAVGPDDHVIEIGAGLGALTEALIETGARVTAIEIDDGLARLLAERLVDRDVRVVHGDARRLDWSELLSSAPRWTLVANLPYNVATPIVADLLDDVPAIDRMLVMVQREVAERFVARPRTRAYGAVTVKIAYWAEVEIIGHVPATVFMPRPKVESALVALRRRPAPAVNAAVDRRALFALVRAGFNQRRKMLRRSLADVVPADAFAEADVSPEARAEELSVADWGRLAAATARAARV
jgi:16S rRNA (adenine1518-N6/adenine1519-N6)-dimethyltransferase